MESNHSDKEKLSPDDSRETETAIAEPEDKAPKTAPEPAAEDEPDFDVRPADTYLGPDYDPKKSAGPKALWLGVLMVAAIIGLTYYAFRSQPVPDQGYEISTAEKTATVSPDTVPAQQTPSLPEKAPDAADFSPTPETEATASTPTSLPATASSSTPPTPAREPAVATAPTTAKATDSAKAGSAKSAAPTQKAKKEEPKPGAAKPATTPAKPAVTTPKPAAPIAETSQPTPAATESTKVKPEAAATEAKAATESKADQAKPAPPKPSETEPAPAITTASTSETKPAPAESAPAQVKPVPAAAAGEISDLWVVNISSTPDVAESNRLLNRVIATDVGGQVYFYETTIDGRVHHRIRVGFFNSRGEAEAVGQKVKETFQLSATPWAVKPTVEEVERYQKK